MAVLGGSLAVSLLVFGVMAIASGSELSFAGIGIVTTLTYLVLITAISSVVEGRRKGVDRLVTGIVASAFLLAMVPLISVGLDGRLQRHRRTLGGVLHVSRCATSSAKAAVRCTRSSARC